MLIRIKSVTWDIIWAAPILNMQNLPMQYMYIDFSAVKIEKFHWKKKKKKKWLDILNIFAQNNDCGYTLVLTSTWTCYPDDRKPQRHVFCQLSL